MLTLNILHEQKNKHKWFMSSWHWRSVGATLIERVHGKVVLVKTLSTNSKRLKFDLQLKRSKNIELWTRMLKVPGGDCSLWPVLFGLISIGNDGGKDQQWDPL